MLKLSLASRARDYRSAANGRRRARDPARMILFDDDIEEANELYIYIYIYKTRYRDSFIRGQLSNSGERTR